MAEAAIIIKIGAVLGGALGALGSVESNIARIGNVTQALSSKQKQLGLDIQKYMGTLAPASLKSLNKDYEHLGHTIDKLKAKQLSLQKSLEMGKTLRDKRQALRSDAMDAVALGASIAIPIKLAADFEAGIKDIAITGNLTRVEEANLGKSIRELSLKFNQSQAASIETTKNLVATGMDIKQATLRLPFLLKAQTAEGVDSADAAQADRQFQLLGVKDMDLAWNQAALAGKLGSFELKNMAKWFPQLGGFMKGLGVTGNEAVVSMAARLQIATRTAGSTDEAGNNFKNYLAKITSADTVLDFKKQGIDLIGSLQASAAQGTDPIAASVGILLDQLKTKSPEAAAELQKVSDAVAQIKDPAEKAAEIERRMGMINSIGERAGLGKFFQDMQAVQYLMAEMQNKDDLNKILNTTKTGKNKSGKDVIDEDFARRMEGASQQFASLKTNLADLGISLGSAILPAVNQLLVSVIPLVHSFADWADKNQSIVAGGLKVLTFLAAVKIGSLAVKYAFNLLFSAANSLRTLFNIITSFTQLAGGLRMAGQAILFIGRALLMNPIGLLITGIAVAAFLIYKYWAPITAFFGKLWTGIKTKFKAGLAWFIELHVQFYDLGKNLITGLVGGITNKLGAAKNAIVNFGKSIKNWFAETLGIKSPSRVFMTMGNHIGDGASIGMQQRIGAVASSAKKLAGAAIAGAALSANPAYAGGAHGAGQAVAIHFSPTIHISGASGNVSGQVQQAMQLSFIEFEKMMKKYEAGKKRVAF